MIQSFPRATAAVGAIVLLVGILVIWQTDWNQPIAVQQRSTGIAPRNMIGTSALSHGGSAPIRDEITAVRGMSSGTPIAQPMIVQPSSHDASQGLSPIALLARPSPTATTSKGPPVPPGTEVVVMDAVDVPGADPDEVERYVEVRLPDGRIGWLPEASLHPRSRGQ